MEKVLPQGGSDIMLKNLYKYVNVPDDVNIIMSRCDESLIVEGKKNIVWVHIPHNQPLVQDITNKYFQRQVNAFVYVSHWQHEKFRFVHQIPLHNTYVIKNAIEPIEFIEKPTTGKKKIVFAAPPYRGLEPMLDSFALLGRDDVDLDVYSSNIIYGSDYVKHEGDRYDHLFNRAKEMPNVNYKGYVPNTELRKALQEAHIFAYPNIFEETSCMTMIEAGAAGCQMITTNIGALPETGSEFATLVPIQADYKDLVNTYTELLNTEINSDIPGSESLYQSEFYNKKYSWELRAKTWENLFKS
jgi:glycosyltransferase involved in cell wall biosynthesis